jgi:hypothetical protein
MAGFKDRDEFLDKLFDHTFPESDYPDGVDEEDEKFFDHIAEFFKAEESNQGGSGGASNAPRRRRRESSSSSTTTRRRRQSSASGDSNYGSNLFFRS